MGDDVVVGACTNVPVMVPLTTGTLRWKELAKKSSTAPAGPCVEVAAPVLDVPAVVAVLVILVVACKFGLEAVELEDSCCGELLKLVILFGDWPMVSGKTFPEVGITKGAGIVLGVTA